MCFKLYGYISMKQGILFLQDFKLGHYMKIPHRLMFMVQVAGSLISAMSHLGTTWWSVLVWLHHLLILMVIGGAANQIMLCVIHHKSSIFKGIAKSVGDWFFDGSGVKLIDCPYPCDKTCHNLMFN